VPLSLPVLRSALGSVLGGDPKPLMSLVISKIPCGSVYGGVWIPKAAIGGFASSFREN
jgi:hypothetical protein